MKPESKELTYKEKRAVVQKQFEDFIKESPRIQKPESLSVIKKAFELADDAHSKQFRKTGLKLPYIVHPIAVAKIVTTEMGFGKTSAVAALLHDVVEDSKGKYTLDDLKEIFGNDVARIVDGVTKIIEGFDPNSTIQVETFKKFINNMAEDKRTAFIKIADRLHNLRTFAGMRENSQMIKTAESYDIYAPLAHMLGLHEIKKEIENLSFKYRMPYEYKKTKNKADSSLNRRKQYLKEISDIIYEKFPKNKFVFRIEYTERSLYRAWRITQTKKIGFNEIHNFNSVRIILKPMKTYSEKQQCFSAYSYLTDLFPVRQHTFKDWITNPKSNGFQALIADIMYKGKWAEVQIMTECMNDVSKTGYASGYENKHTENVYRWVNSIKEILNSKELTSQEILELIRPQHREIYTLSPKGEIVKLPKNSTVLDFAFQIHTDLGINFQAAEVNGKLVSYNYRLDNADQVKIISSEKNEPRKEWIKSLASHRNRNILRQYFRKQKRKTIKEGEKKFTVICEKQKFDEGIISKLINKYNCDDIDDFYYRVANEVITENDINATIKNRRGVFGIVSNILSSEKIETGQQKKFSSKDIFFIKDLDNISFAKCCRPVVGDTVMVYRKEKNKFIVHRSDCKQAKNLNSTDGKNTAKAYWDIVDDIMFRTTIKFNGVDNKGLLSEMIVIISNEHNINMTSLIVSAEKNTFKGTIGLMVSNVDSINNILKKIRKIKYIKKAYRVSKE
ncbi:MAG: HD domain-containing protein [Bacteroidales bacterium]|nr:HD domain-containing protein [Bacteroidales bacterium]